MTIDEMPDLLTHREVATYFRISQMTLYRWSKQGLISALRINNRSDRRYQKEDVIALKNSFKI